MNIGKNVQIKNTISIPKELHGKTGTIISASNKELSEPYWLVQFDKPMVIMGNVMKNCTIPESYLEEIEVRN